MSLKLEFSEGREFKPKKKPSVAGSMDIFWNNTFDILYSIFSSHPPRLELLLLAGLLVLFVTVLLFG